MRRALSLVGWWTVSTAGFALPQQPVTRADAVTAALARGGRAAIGRADTTAAAAQDAARYGFAFERAAIRFDVDTTYTRALAALAWARLSRRNAGDADSQVKMAELRRQVGDVSDLDVRRAAVSAGHLENAAADDSLAAVDALVAVQLAMGLPAEEPTITLTDSLAPPTDTVSPASGEPLPIAAAVASLRSAERLLTLAHRSVFAAPSLQLGVEQGDPTGPGGLLPTVGLSLPLPLFNWNGGEVAQAAAARERAQAHVDRDRRLLASADRVAAMSLTAYAEGAVALPNVLEAQRNSREALGRYIDEER